MWYCGECGHVFEKVVGEGLVGDVMAHEQKHHEERRAAFEEHRRQAAEWLLQQPEVDDLAEALKPFEGG